MSVEAQVLRAITDFKEAARKRLLHARDGCVRTQLRGDACRVATDLVRTLPTLQPQKQMIEQALLEAVDELAA